MADDPVDISGMPDPGTIGLSAPAQVDPTAHMPTPAQLYRQYHGYDASAPEEVDDFMRQGIDPNTRVTKETLKHGASALTGLPRAAASFLAAVPAGVASLVGQGTGALGAALDPAHAGEHLEQGRDRGRDWAAKVNKLADYVPATERGAEAAQNLASAPGELIKANVGDNLKAVLPDNAYQAVTDVATDVGNDLPALGAPAAVRAGVKGVAKGASAVKNFVKSEAASVAPPAPKPAITPPVGAPITGASLRAQPNPIPPPDGTVAAAKPKVAPRRAVAVPAQEPPTAPAEPTAPGMSQVPGQEPTAQPPAPAAAATPSPADAQRGSVRLFNAPKDEGPQETPTPDQQDERLGHLKALDELSGGGLPTRRESALSGDYNATGTDWEHARVGNEKMQGQLATENNALHGAMENVHNSVGSEFENSVDPTTLGDRGRVTRGAVQAIEKHFDDATDAIYNTARETSQGRKIPKLSRVEAYLNDDSNFTNDAEIGLQRAAKQRLQRLWSTGDPDKGTPPGSVNAAERLREFLNEKGKNPSAMGVAGDLKGHLDMDVAEHGGPGLFQAARAMRRHKYQMLEEPTGIKKLLAPADSQGINHAIPEHKVMDYIADLPREQHEHVMNVLRAGAHLGEGELAEQSAQAIKEIQAHMISRIHDAATNDGGKWNARTFHSAAERYGRNAASTFKDRPDVLKNLKTINDAGNTLHMDKSYHGAVGQAERTGAVGHAIEMLGAGASGFAHELPMGRILGRAIERGTERMTGKLGESSRDRAVAKRIVNREGERGSVQVMPEEKKPLGAIAPGNQRGAVGDLSQRDAIEHGSSANNDAEGTVAHRYKVPNNRGVMTVKERPGLGVRQVRESSVLDKGQGWGTRMLQRAADDAHAKGQVLRSDSQVSEGQVGAYKNLAQLGYDVKLKPHDKVQGAYHSVGDHVFEVRPGKGQQPLGARAPGNQRGAVGDLKLKTDNPGGDWLKGKQESAAEQGKNEFGVPRVFGSVTGSFDRPINIPTEKLAQVPGMRGEQSRVRAASLASLKDVMKNGKLPPGPSTGGEYHPFIMVGHDGKPYVNEGNHRIMAAHDLGWSHVPTEVRYFNGGERAPGPFHPDTLKADDAKLQGTPRMSPLGARAPGNQRGSVRVMNDENASNHEKVLSSIASRASKNGVDLKTSYVPDASSLRGDMGGPAIWVNWLENKGKSGAGLDTMHEIAAHADQHQLPMMMEADSPALQRLYKSVGAEADPAGGNVMVRNPKISQDGGPDASNPNARTAEEGSQLNIGLHQGNKGEPGFRKMSKQEVHAAIESTGAKVTKSTVLQPGKHAVQEPTLVASTDRPITDHQMQDILAKTKQSAIPQRTAQGDESMHVAPGHEQTAKEQGWDQFSPDYFMEHSGQNMSATGAIPTTENKFPPHPAATVKDAKQSKFPGIYDDPKDIMERLPPKLEESPHMKDIFGVSRKDLHDSAVERGDVAPKTPIPGIAPKGKGSAHASNVTNPENAERIRNIISAYKEHDPSGYHGMVGWYEMDPMYHSIKKILGGNEKMASAVYHKLNSYTSYASPMSSVDPEIRRGTAAATMAAEGKFDTFAKQGGMPQEKAPAALQSKNFELGNEGHAMHSTAHAGAMSRFHDTGEEARAVKTGTYRRSGDAPSRSDSEYQNTVPVGDSHWSRGAGLADVRGAAAFEGSAEGPEMKVLHSWYHDNVARHPDIDLPSTSAQAVQWGALSKETGVESPIGAPKLEIWSNQIAAAAKRAGVEPKEMWKRIVKRLASQ